MICRYVGENMINLIELNGKKIIITGASSGIGREIAVLTSMLGAQLILIARNTERLENVISRLEGTNHKYYSYDLSDIDGIELLIKTIINDNGPVDGFVHSAGISGSRPLHMLKPKNMNDVMDINFNSFVEIIRCLSKRNNLKPNASIVGISSVAGQQGNISKTAYCASKAAMDASVRCIAKELAKNGVRANTVAPGLTDTPIFKRFLDNSGNDSKDAQMVLERQYLGLISPQNVANTVAFLLSDASKFITGQVISIDSGRLSS